MPTKRGVFGADLMKFLRERPDLVPFVAAEYSRARDYFAWQAKALGLPF